MEAKKQSAAQLEQALREKTREVDVLHRISESISNTLDLEAVLKHIVDVVVEVTKADACLLYLLSDRRDELILRASKNPHPKLIGRITSGRASSSRATPAKIHGSSSTTTSRRTGITRLCRCRSW
jgi:GAF domain-containing protein